MLKLSDGRTVLSASDLTAASSCEFAVLRAVDRLHGRVPHEVAEDDPMLARVSALGDQHERDVLGTYQDQFGAWDGSRGVAMIGRPVAAEYRSADVLTAKHHETLRYLEAGADVVYQGAFFDGSFVGWSDFLVRTPGGWQVQDTKLARSATIEALLQLAAYADQLASAGIPVSDEVALLLGSGTTSRHGTGDLVAVHRDRLARLRALVDDRIAAPEPLAWGSAGVTACLRCASCTPFVEQTRDLILVAGLRTGQRARLHAEHITTLEQLAVSTANVPGIGTATLATLRRQAALQQRQDEAGPDAEPVWEIVDGDAIAALPVPDPGDIFFDFEGDPLWRDPTPSSDATDAWGLEYLFGFVEAPVGAGDPVFRTFWAHDRAQEKAAMAAFMEYLQRRRAEHPGMHVYHYAPYERTALLRLAGRHGVAEEPLDQLLRDGVLVDLYATVRAGLRTGQRSYSLKKVEALYGRTHAGAVEKADQSIVAYADACAHRDAGDEEAWRAGLDDIADYNRTDCLSTLELRDWLLARGAERGVLPGGATATAPARPEEPAEPEDESVRALLRFADEAAASDEPASRDAHHQAAAMLACAVGYHRREAKPFWWGHFDRLSADPDDWTDKRSTLVAHEVTVLEDWQVPPRARTHKRLLRVTGRLEPGTDLTAGKEVYLLYAAPFPPSAKTSEGGLRAWCASAKVVEARTAGADEHDELVVEEGGVPQAEVPHTQLPVALTPSPGPSTAPLERAIAAAAATAAVLLPELPPGAVTDLLERTAPRTVSGRGLREPDGGEDHIDAIVATLRDLDRSYLAVQGPPGTGKTFVGARVVRRLVEDGWKVGVVAQSHAVVENFLRECLTAGLPADRIGKRSDGDHRPPWTPLGNDFGAFFEAQRAGFLVGGTAWDLTNQARVPAGGYDLLVVDEAGQFALANTVAVAGSAARLLLLGDPQQLPQVSQGTHPEPVDVSALGWLSAGHDTLPPELGYFLPVTYRMHRDLCAKVSALAYDGRLHPHPTADARRLEDVEPGVSGVAVEHAGNTVVSREEAAEVVRQVRSFVARTWHDEDGTRPLAPEDVLVVAAYNAQVAAIRHALDEAGLPATRVGTVDKFQGQQAAVVLVSMAASSAADVPRGIEFLLDRNRLNVAVSRGKWCARILHSPALTDYLPTHPDRLADLGAFLRVLAAQVPPRVEPNLPAAEPLVRYT